MELFKYAELTSPFIQPKAIFHMEKFREIEKGIMPVPVTCEIDLTDGFCNHKCTHCFFGTNTKENPIILETEIAKNLIHELAEHGVKGVEFSGGGEPTTHPKICEIIEYATSLGISVGLITNGSLLNKVFPVANKLDFIRISLDAGTRETHELIHGVSEFDRIIDNIKNLSNYMNPTKIGVGFLIVENNINDILKAAELVKQLKCRFIQFRPASLTYDVEDTLWEKAHEEVKKAKKLETDNFQVFDAGVKWKHLNEKRCYQKCWTSCLVSVVKATGDIPLCILNRNNEKMFIGNVKNGGFFKQWYGEKHKELINQIDVQTCRKPCKHDSYNIAYEAYKEGLYNINFI